MKKNLYFIIVILINHNISAIFNWCDDNKTHKWAEIERQKAYEREANNMKTRGQIIPMNTISKLSPRAYKAAIKHNSALVPFIKK